MSDDLSRRELLRLLGASGLAAGMGALSASGAAHADQGDAAGGAPSKRGGAPAAPAVVADGKVVQPQRELPVLHRTGVLVVGGGPAGVAAAVAAARTGVDVTLVERYGYFGGLWTGGLVLIVLGMFSKDKKQLTRGVGEEIMQRLDKTDHGIINRRPGVHPTVDAEATKYVMQEMIREAGVRVLLHSWCVDAIMAGEAVRGAVFESKSGRQAVLADVVVDATGDGDVFAAAGAAHERRKYNVGLVCRIGGLDKIDPAKLRRDRKKYGLGSPTPVAGVRWVNMRGPSVDGLDVTELTRLEMDHRRHIWRQMAKLHADPDYKDVALIETGPQLGVRITRVLDGVGRLTRRDAAGGRRFDDVVGVAGRCYGLKDGWQIPYGALTPRKVDNILAAGRCIAGDPKMADPLRLIAPCFVTGHAAGAAAALAVKDRCRARDVDVSKLQTLLKQQGAYLG